MSNPLPTTVDTVIVGNGPSALILSYILHGHIPVYDASRGHPDPWLHQKLKDGQNLLDADIDYLTNHFCASRFSYSTQALPVNVLLDTLIRPYGETDDTDEETCVRWIYKPEKAISHIVVGNTASTGGQWVDNPVEASWDIETLSYAGMLSLPEYGFAKHHEKVTGKSLPPFSRPSRRQVAAYFAEYSRQVGIDKAMFCGETLDGISRTADGFFIASHGLSCRNLVLATGIFSELIPPRPLLQPLLSLPKPRTLSLAPPLLVIGSGFSAADVIISTPRDRKILHIFKWAPDTSPSPLRACHQQAYPEYAGVYRRMKLAATGHGSRRTMKPKLHRTASSAFDVNRDWQHLYEGLPNTVITDVKTHGDTATITCQSQDGSLFQREVSGLAYVVGRRGSLSYLDSSLQAEICPNLSEVDHISGSTLRQKAFASTEVAESIFIMGSLTGDSLVRFAYGGCTYAAGRIMLKRCPIHTGLEGCGSCACSSVSSSPRWTNQSSTRSSPIRLGLMNGLDGHNISVIDITN